MLDSGVDLPGDLVFGDRALEDTQTQATIVAQSEYPRLAEETLRGPAPGSSAGGEQPKFVTCAEDVGHVIVKFSAKGTDPVTRRWRDILICEHHALNTLQEQGVAAAHRRIIEEGERTFLEVKRFDRTGMHGRKSTLSLAAVDAEFVGSGRDWLTSMRGLLRRSLLPEEDVHRATFLQLFGAWIGNTDMHLGNLSLQPEEHGFSLLPVYDMNPMLWAPVGNELAARQNIAPPVRDPRFHSSWDESARLALVFWQRVGAEPLLSNDFRAIATDTIAVIEGYLS